MLQTDGDPKEKRKVGTQKAFPQKIKCLMTRKGSLLANRRGIVSHFNDQEKPSFSAEELIENRRGGISFSSIGKKLGIDNKKEEVLSVFAVMKECDETLPDISEVDKDCAMVKNYPTPLWFLFNSELDIIAKESIPAAQFFLETNVQERVAGRLGERAEDMLTTCIQVNDIVKEELCSSITNCSALSYLGKLSLWTNGLQKKLIASCSDTATCVAKSAMQHTTHLEAQSIGRCQCGGVKVLKVNWKCVSDTPSFFWGCSRYRAFERYQHDRAVPFRSATIKSVVDNANHVSKVTTKELQHIKMMITDNDQLFKDCDSELSRKVLGCSAEESGEVESISTKIDDEIKKRNERSTTIFPQSNDIEETL